MNDARSPRRATPRRTRRVERGAAAVVSQYIRDMADPSAARLRQTSPEPARLAAAVQGG
jgi:hypothetical protein